jgi:hypothetical protein
MEFLHEVIHVNEVVFFVSVHCNNIDPDDFKFCIQYDMANTTSILVYHQTETKTCPNDHTYTRHENEIRATECIENWIDGVYF